MSKFLNYQVRQELAWTSAIQLIYLGLNSIERGIALSRQGQQSTATLPINLVNRTVHLKRQDTENLPTLRDREADNIRFVLDRCAQNRTRAAKFLALTGSRYGVN